MNAALTIMSIIVLIILIIAFIAGVTVAYLHLPMKTVVLSAIVLAIVLSAIAFYMFLKILFRMP